MTFDEISSFYPILGLDNAVLEVIKDIRHHVEFKIERIKQRVK